MTSSSNRWRAGVAAVLLAALPVAAVSASPAAAPVDAAGSIVQWIGGWVDGWLARLLPVQATAGGQSAPAEPPPTVAPGEDSLLSPVCKKSLCAEVETLPDWDPNG